MGFTSQVSTTREQSESLLTLGLKKETTDCFLEYVGRDNYGNNVWHPSIIVNNYRMPDYSRDFPAWSLHRLVEMIPQEVIVSGTEYKLSIDSYLCIEYISEELSNPIKYFWKGNMFDRIICCIKWLIEEGHFNKEYLEE